MGPFKVKRIAQHSSGYPSTSNRIHRRKTRTLRIDFQTRTHSTSPSVLLLLLPPPAVAFVVVAVVAAISFIYATILKKTTATNCHSPFTEHDIIVSQSTMANMTRISIFSSNESRVKSTWQTDFAFIRKVAVVEYRARVHEYRILFRVYSFHILYKLFFYFFLWDCVQISIGKKSYDIWKEYFHNKLIDNKDKKK